MNKKQQEMTRDDEIKKEHGEEVTASGVKNVLWETIGDLRRKRIKVEEAEAIVKASNGIISTVKLELEASKILGGAGDGLIQFAFSNKEKVIYKRLPDQEAYEKKALKGQDVQGH